MSTDTRQINRITSPWARAAFSALSVMWAGAAWLVLLEGGFHRTVKYSQATTFVGGAGGYFMAFVFFFLATVASWVVLQSLHSSRQTYVMLFIFFFLPPSIFFVMN